MRKAWALVVRYEGNKINTVLLNDLKTFHYMYEFSASSSTQ